MISTDFLSPQWSQVVVLSRVSFLYEGQEFDHYVVIGCFVLLWNRSENIEYIHRDTYLSVRQPNTATGHRIKDFFKVNKYRA